MSQPQEMIWFYDHVGEIYEHKGHVYEYNHKSDITGEMLYYYILKEKKDENIPSGENSNV